MHLNHTTNNTPRLCECGCGNPAPVAINTNAKRGWVKGQPVRFISGHNGRKYSADDGPNPSGLCMCGCGQRTPIASETHKEQGYIAGQPVRFIVGHNPKKRVEQTGAEPCGHCACGCGTPIYPGRYATRQPRYAPGHNRIWARPTEDRFWRKVSIAGPNDCWLWTGVTGEYGHGIFSIGTKRIGAHRFAYILTYGPIADDILVCHNCPDGDRPACCNPAHLFKGTHADNMKDMVAKGRSTRRISRAQGDAARKLYADGMTQQAIADQLGIGQSHISRIIRNQAWKHDE